MMSSAKETGKNERFGTNAFCGLPLIETIFERNEEQFVFFRSC